MFCYSYLYVIFIFLLSFCLICSSLFSFCHTLHVTRGSNMWCALANEIIENMMQAKPGKKNVYMFSLFFFLRDHHEECQLAGRWDTWNRAQVFQLKPHNSVCIWLNTHEQAQTGSVKLPRRSLNSWTIMNRCYFKPQSF